MSNLLRLRNWALRNFSRREALLNAIMREIARLTTTEKNTIAIKAQAYMVVRSKSRYLDIYTPISAKYRKKIGIG